MVQLMTYATLDEAESWHRPRRTPNWLLPDTAPDTDLEATARLDEQKLAALIRASDWLDSRIRWKGQKADLAQSRAWPRTGLPGIVGIPAQVRDACCELAAHFMTADPLAPQERGGRILAATVDCLSVTYAPDAPVDTLFPLVIGLVRDLGEPETGQVDATRAACVEVGRG